MAALLLGSRAPAEGTRERALQILSWCFIFSDLLIFSSLDHPIFETSHIQNFSWSSDPQIFKSSNLRIFSWSSDPQPFRFPDLQTFSLRFRFSDRIMMLHIFRPLDLRILRRFDVQLQIFWLSDFQILSVCLSVYVFIVTGGAPYVCVQAVQLWRTGLMAGTALKRLMAEYKRKNSLLITLIDHIDH